jgi:hypothetical protein
MKYAPNTGKALSKPADSVTQVSPLKAGWTKTAYVNRVTIIGSENSENRLMD